MRRYILPALFAVILVATAATFFLGGNEENGVEFAVSRRRDVVQEVSVTGRVVPQEKVELAFEVSGRVAEVRAYVGGRVERNAVLARLDGSGLAASLSEATAALRAEEAKLDELRQGTRIEDIDVKQAELAKANIDLENLYAGVPTTLSGAVIKAEDAVNKQLDPLFTDELTQTPELSFETSNSQAEVDAESGMAAAQNALVDVRTLANLSLPDADTAENALVRTRDALVVVRRLLDDVTRALNAEGNLTASTVSTYKTNVDTAKTSVNNAHSAIDDVMQDIASQKALIAKIERELALERAGSTPQAISAQEATVEKARASVSKIKVQLDQTALRSPIAGTVTTQDVRVGEVVSSGTHIATVISGDALEIEARIPEADIAHVEIGDTASVTLDAYGSDEVFHAEVASIDPAGTLVEGVPTYKVTLVFVDDRGMVRSGMTANVDIITAEKFDVLVIPARAVIEKGGRRFVRVPVGPDGVYEERDVAVGVRDALGNVEILRGLTEGERVVTFTP